MELRTVTEEDVALRISMETDPAMMAELGGPISKERIEKAYSKALQSIAAGTCWCFKIIPDGSQTAAGTMAIWLSSWRDEPINEMGWMILPQFQGKGLASQAAKQILHMAKAQTKFQFVHAFPGISNLPSNAICRKAGFSKLEECEVDYAERILQCNHWVIQVF